MATARNFAADLLKSGESVKETKKKVDSVYGDKGLSIDSLYKILKKIKAGEPTVDQRRFNAKKTIRSPTLIAAVAADIEADRRIGMHRLASAHHTSYGTIFNIIHEDLGLVKKSARWVPKLLSLEQQEARVTTCEAFIKLVANKGRSILDNIITMDESAVSMHTPETKSQSKQWLKKGTPGPVKAKVQATRTKQMVLAFFDSKGMVYTNNVPRGKTVNADYIIGALRKFLKALKAKRPELVPGEWLLHWDNAPVHTAQKVMAFLAEKSIQTLPHPPYSPDLAPADFFLFPTVKRELAGISMTQKEFKNKWEGVIRSISKDDFTRAFQRWLERCEKCVRINGSYVEKS
jgi:histone-lysine N-methyltransferase SETMAR